MGGLTLMVDNLVDILLGLGLGLGSNNLVRRLWVLALEGESLGRLWGLVLVSEHCGV